MLDVCPVVKETHMDKQLSIECHLIRHQETVSHNAFVEICCLDIFVCVAIFGKMSKIEIEVSI